MFLDEVKIFIKAGDGGDGIVAFRREKYVAMGGPAGGDGGNGGNVIFEVDEGLNTLMKFRYNRHYKAKRGENGQSKGMHGRNAEDLVVPVPPGTTIVDDDTGVVVADLTTHLQRATIAKGGRGGRGNTRFTSPRNPAPNIAENGEPGEERNLRLELKVLADVGLVGFPSVGKSTLLSAVSAARPKIADYHFTTLAPNLGVVETEDHRSFVMADLPGLIEGAHEGTGLGHQFLKHVERTRVILHVIDISGMEGRDPYDDYIKINEELRQYDVKIMERPQIVLLNKMDLPNSKENAINFKNKLSKNIKVYEISAFTREGLREVLFAVADELEKIPKITTLDEPSNEKVVYRFEPKEQAFTITRDSDGAYVISGAEIEKLFKMTDFTKYEATQRFSRQLRTMGVDEALRKRGVQDGDIVRLLDYEFEFID